MRGITLSYMNEQGKKAIVRNKPQVNWTLDADVVLRVKELSLALHLPESQFANMQLRVALGMMDKTASDFLNRGGGSHE